MLIIKLLIHSDISIHILLKVLSLLKAFVGDFRKFPIVENERAVYIFKLFIMFEY